jgi:hypothetical protein
MDRAIDPAAAEERRVRGVDDRVNAKCGDVGNDDFQPRLADQARRQASGRGVDRDALVGKQLLQLAGLEHLADDIAAADKLALDVELRNGRPVRE